MADINSLKAFIDTYGVAVRAGLITPCIEDEVVIRDKMGLPLMSEAIKADWAKTENIRKPITLAGAAGASAERLAAVDGANNA